jgi:hypothetical protein
LGFIGISNSEIGRSFLNWWAERLFDKCFVDKLDGFFTDQKWADFIPSLFPDYRVLRNKGCNMAIWNLHERELTNSDEGFYVKMRNRSGDEIKDKLIFFHYSNFRFSECDNLDEFLPVSGMKSTFNDLLPIINIYQTKLKNSNFKQLNKKYTYKFSFYNNGEVIQKMHRRFYRILLENGVAFKDPFTVNGNNSFYFLMKKNKLIFNSDVANSKALDLNEFSKKKRIIDHGFFFVSKIVGIKNYSIFCRFAIRFFRYENQAFLIRDHKIPFKDDTALNSLQTLKTH